MSPTEFIAEYDDRLTEEEKSAAALSGEEHLFLMALRTAFHAPQDLTNSNLLNHETRQQLQEVMALLKRYSVKKLGFAKPDSNTPINDDERLIFDLIGGVQASLDYYCRALLLLFVEQKTVAKGRFMFARLSATLAKSGIIIRHRLCDGVCRRLLMGLPECPDQGKHLKH